MYLLTKRAWEGPTDRQTDRQRDNKTERQTMSENNEDRGLQREKQKHTVRQIQKKWEMRAQSLMWRKLNPT